MIFKNFLNLSQELQQKSVEFLKKYELLCVQLCANFKKNPGKTFVIFSKENSSAIYGIVFIKNTILHCLPYAKNLKNQKFNLDFCESFSEFIKKNQKSDLSSQKKFPICVNGEKSGSLLILKSLKNLKKIPQQTNEYKLFRLNVKDFFKIVPPKIPENFKILRKNQKISEQEFSSLLKIQAAYEKEEVLPKFETFNEELCALKLKNLIKNQIILTLENENQKIVSKAQTSAIGFNAFLLGGVFTPKEFRKNHFSFTLLFYFIKKILRFKKMPVLFAKISNQPALKLYESLKFTEISEYLIAYF